MMEEVGMVMRGLWKRRNGVMWAISIASICMNVVMLVLNKRSKMGSYWSALVQMVTSHPSLQGPLLYLLFNILLIFPLLLQSGLLKHHHHPHPHHYPYDNKSTMPIASHSNSYTRGIVATMTSSTTSNHNNRASSARGGEGSRHSPPIKHTTHDHGEHHVISHNKNHPMQTTSTRTSSISRTPIIHKKNLHKVSPSPHRLHFKEHQPRTSLLSSNVSHFHPPPHDHHHQQQEQEEEQQQQLSPLLLHHSITPQLPIGVALTCLSANTPSHKSHGESAVSSARGGGGGGGGVRREMKKASLFTIEPWEEEEEEDEKKDKKERLVEEEEEVMLMSSVELKEKAERFIVEFRRKNLMTSSMTQRQDSFNRLLSLLRSSAP